MRNSIRTHFLISKYGTMNVWWKFFRYCDTGKANVLYMWPRSLLLLTRLDYLGLFLIFYAGRSCSVQGCSWKRSYQHRRTKCQRIPDKTEDL